MQYWLKNRTSGFFLGDNIYGDTDGSTAWLVSKEQMTGEWNRLADKPEFQKARATIPIMATWDNHDYGSHAGGGEFQVPMILNWKKYTGKKEKN